MIRARVQRGRVEAQDPIPEEWEGQYVQLIPLTPDDPLPNLDECLRALEVLGPMEYEPGEREIATAHLKEQDRLSRTAMENLGGGPA